MQGGIPLPILFDILFDFIIREVIQWTAISGVKFSYDSDDLFHIFRLHYNERSRHGIEISLYHSKPSNF